MFLEISKYLQETLCFIKKKLQHRGFPVKFANKNMFFRWTPPVAPSVIFTIFFLLDQIPLKVRVIAEAVSCKKNALDLQLY